MIRTLAWLLAVLTQGLRASHVPHGLGWFLALQLKESNRVVPRFLSAFTSNVPVTPNT